jgi:ribonuclease J
MADGEQIEVNPKYLKKVKSVKSGKVYIDNQLNNKISDDVVIDRQTMAKEGIVMIVAQINENDRTLEGKPKVASFGFISDKQDRFFTNEIEILEF